MKYQINIVLQVNTEKDVDALYDETEEFLLSSDSIDVYGGVDDYSMYIEELKS